MTMKMSVLASTWGSRLCPPAVGKARSKSPRTRTVAVYSDGDTYSVTDFDCNELPGTTRAAIGFAATRQPSRTVGEARSKSPRTSSVAVYSDGDTYSVTDFNCNERHGTTRAAIGFAATRQPSQFGTM